VERGDIGSWIGGPLPSDTTYRGQRMGLPENGPGSMAATWRRVVALFVDWLTAGMVARLLIDGSNPRGQSLMTMAIFAAEVILLTWLMQASFGQRLVGIRVIGLAGRLGIVACVVRTLLICLLIPAIIWDTDGRGLHDRAVGSAVVRG